MKKSKFLIFAALAAAATISVGCSNDDVVTTKDSGVPLKVTAGVNDGTRAQQITSLNYFQLYGFLGDTTTNSRIKHLQVLMDKLIGQQQMLFLHLTGQLRIPITLSMV